MDGSFPASKCDSTSVAHPGEHVLDVEGIGRAHDANAAQLLLVRHLGRNDLHHQRGPEGAKTCLGHLGRLTDELEQRHGEPDAGQDPVHLVLEQRRPPLPLRPVQDFIDAAHGLRSEYRHSGPSCQEIIIPGGQPS